MDLETRIEDLLDKTDVEDSNLIIIEDVQDTKKTTIEEVKKAFNGDNNNPSSLRFYSSEYMKNILDSIINDINNAASKNELDKLSNRVSQIVASAARGEDTEVVYARDGEDSLDIRLDRDKKELSDIKLDKVAIDSTISGNPVTIKNPYNIPIGRCEIVVNYSDPTKVGELTLSYGDPNAPVFNITAPGVTLAYTIDADSCEFSCNIVGAIIQVTYKEYKVDTKYLLNRVNELETVLLDTRDKCGLIEDYGTYVYPDLSLMYNKNEDDATYTLSNDVVRDSRKTLKVHTSLGAKGNPKFTMKCDPIKFELCTLVFYVSKSIIKAFDSADGIIIKLSSDSPALIPSNYYQYNISNGEMINGWNCLKKPLKDFIKVGSPDRTAIQSIRIEINRNNKINGSNIYISSVIFNQRMKPTLLLNFNGVYDHGFEYTYPYLYSRNIPCTIFTNTGTTLSKDYKAKLCKYHYTYGWDIGSYGCNPNKELLLDGENDYEQYINLLETDEYIKTLRANPISYSAPFGNIQDNTIRILKDIGYKTARIETSRNTYCSFFGKNDFCIPVIKVGNTDMAEDIIAKIDYAIETGQAIAIFTNEVTEYGTEVSLKEITFETVIDYVQSKVADGKLKVSTFEKFYKECMN